MHDPTLEHKRGGLGVGLFLFCLAIPAAYSISFIGRLFVGDFLMGAIGVLGLKSLLMEGRTGWQRAAGWVLLAFPILAVGLDIVNQVQLNDLLRGLARNLAFVCTILTSLFVLGRFGFYAWAWFSSGLYISQLLHGILDAPYLLSEWPVLVKYFWGSFIVTPLLLLWPRLVFVNCAIMVVAGVGTFFMDCRSYGLLWIFAAGVLLNRALFGSTKVGWMRLLRVAMIAAFSFAIYVLYDSMYEEVVDRWQNSNRERTSVAMDAIENSLENPWTGLGTWVHTSNYIDTENSELLLGVHSALLLLCVEYGVSGLLVGLVCLALLGLGLIRLMRGRVAGRYDHWDGAGAILTMVLLEGGFTMFFSPFYGAIRFILGMAVGLSLHLLRVTTPEPEVSQPVRLVGRESRALSGPVIAR